MLTHHGHQINYGLTETIVTGNGWDLTDAQGYNLELEAGTRSNLALEAGEMLEREQIGVRHFCNIGPGGVSTQGR